jgi:hypothetical protein
MHTHKQKSENANANSHEHISTSRARTHTHTRKHQHRNTCTRHLQSLDDDVLRYILHHHIWVCLIIPDSIACEDIEEGTVVAGFGAVRQLREREEGTRTRLGYTFIVKEREGKSLTITPKHGVTEGCMAHVIKHTCHPDFANCRFVHAGIVGGWSEDERGGIGGRRTSEVFVKTTKRVESDVELFANYGTKFLFAGGCVCHLCRPLEP